MAAGHLLELWRISSLIHKGVVGWILVVFHFYDNSRVSFNFPLHWPFIRFPQHICMLTDTYMYTTAPQIRKLVLYVLGPSACKRLFNFGDHKRRFKKTVPGVQNENAGFLLMWKDENRDFRIRWCHSWYMQCIQGTLSCLHRLRVFFFDEQRENNYHGLYSHPP